MKKPFVLILITFALVTGCKSSEKRQASKSGLNKTQKGVIIGASSGAVVGGIIGNKSKNTALGAILGAVVGGTVGGIIGNQMDKQAKEIEDELGKTVSVERVGEGIKITFNSQLLFDTGKDELMEANKIDLKKFAETLNQYPDTDLLIVGHTDNVGSTVANQTLSEKRGDAVSTMLSSFGVSNSRLKVEGKGESQPTVANDTELNRSKNRRVEIAVYANEKMKAEAKK